GIPKAILSDPATVERVVLGQTIAERFPDGPRVEKRERILLSVELIGDKLAVDARVLDAEVDLAQVNVFTAEPGFEASNSLFCIVKRLRRRSGNPRFHQIGGRETLCCRVDSDVNGRRHDTQSCPAVRWVTELAPIITHGLNVYIASGTRGTGSLSGCRLEGLERAIDLCRSSYPNRQGAHSCGASFPQPASPSPPKGALSSPWKTPPIHSRSLTEQAAEGGASKDLPRVTRMLSHIPHHHQSSLRSRHSGLLSSMSAIFLLRLHPLICFSRSIAASGLPAISTCTSR